MVYRTIIEYLKDYFRKPGFWFILLLLVLITLLHYSEVLEYPPSFIPWISNLGLDRHAFERVLYLAPIVWAGFIFGWRGAFIVSLVSLAGMLPRAILISDHPKDALLETSIVFIIGNVLAISFSALRREREYRKRLEVSQEEQQKITEELKVMQQNLRHYLRQATRAQEEERKRISHELHDDTIQALVVLSRRLDALASSKEGMSEENRQQIEALWQQADDILKGVRRLSQDLRPAALDRLGLLPAIEWLASSVNEYSGITTDVKVIGEERRLTEEAAIALFRITQEALRNVWRHSGASSAHIKVEFLDDKVRVIVSDNGKGFIVPQNIGDMAKDGKLGLTGMRERAQLIGGTLTVLANTDEGTVITVEIPG